MHDVAWRRVLVAEKLEQPTMGRSSTIEDQED